MHLLLICFLFSCASCAPKLVEVVEVQASVRCNSNTEERCYSVTQNFIDEHRALFVENIRLKAACPK
jgi:hypothetical protein